MKFHNRHQTTLHFMYSDKDTKEARKHIPLKTVSQQEQEQCSLLTGLLYLDHKLKT